MRGWGLSLLASRSWPRGDRGATLNLRSWIVFQSAARYSTCDSRAFSDKTHRHYCGLHADFCQVLGGVNNMNYQQSSGGTSIWRVRKLYALPLSWTFQKIEGRRRPRSERITVFRSEGKIRECSRRGKGERKRRKKKKKKKKKSKRKSNAC